MSHSKTRQLKLTKNFKLRQRNQSKVLAREEIDAIQKRFLAEVSHELRTPLSVIKMYVEAIEDGMFGSNDKAFEKLHVKLAEFESLMNEMTKSGKS